MVPDSPTSTPYGAAAMLGGSLSKTWNPASTAPARSTTAATMNAGNGVGTTAPPRIIVASGPSPLFGSSPSTVTLPATSIGKTSPFPAS